MSKMTDRISTSSAAEQARKHYESEQRSKLPSIIAPLASAGKIYPKDHPLREGKIEMRYMTAYDEDILTNTSYIREGIMLNRLLESISLTKFDVSDLSTYDKDGLLIYTRILSYGAEYNVKVTDPKTGAITPSYTLSPEAKAYQDALSGMATQSLTAGQGLMNLGQQYIGESPEAVRNRYIQTQQALLAPQQEQSLAALRNRQAATGRGGLAFGATSDGMMATNPEIAAYYNSLAQTQRQLAANAETQYQNQVNFGSGLLTNATTPFTNVFSAQKGVESAAQQPLELSTNFANTVAQRGSDQARNYATAMAPSLKANYEAANYDPFATFISGLSNDALVKYGLTKLIP